MDERAAEYISASGEELLIGILNRDRYEAWQQRKAGFLAALGDSQVSNNIVADQEGFIAYETTRIR